MIRIPSVFMYAWFIFHTMLSLGIIKAKDLLNKGLANNLV